MRAVSANILNLRRNDLNIIQLMPQPPYHLLLR